MLKEYLDKLKLEKKFQIVDWGYTENVNPLTFQKFENWINLKRQGPLNYLADHRFNTRKSLKNFYPNYQSAIGFLFSYESTHYELKKKYKENESNLKVASYTLGFDGLDYHLVLKEYLNEIKEDIKKIYPDFEIAITLDVHPVLERDLIYSMGLGFFGKNTMLIHPKLGSFFIIGSLLINKKLQLPIKKVEANHCGQCTRCIDACPTEALDNHGLIASRCISTFTIEQFGSKIEIDPKMNLNSGYIFGCDICQEVCPFNKRREREKLIIEKVLSSKAEQILDFLIKGKIDEIVERIKSFSNKQYKTYFLGTSFFRSGKNGLLKNYLKAQKDLD